MFDDPKGQRHGLAAIHAMVHADEIEVPNLSVTTSGVQFESVDANAGDTAAGVGGHYVDLDVLARASRKGVDAMDKIEKIGKGVQGAASAL